MRKNLIIVFLSALGLCGCSVANGLYVDDAYYWLATEQKAAAALQATTVQEAESRQEAKPVQSAKPTVTYTNVQDTTITAVIKR